MPPAKSSPWPPKYVEYSTCVPSAENRVTNTSKVPPPNFDWNELAVGKSVDSVQKFDVPLMEATTSSLEALQAYSMGNKVLRENGSAACLPYYHRAIELDPNFATAYLSLGGAYNTLGEVGRGAEYVGKAFELREHASEREKLTIASGYYQFVTGELDKAAEVNQQLIENYPRQPTGYNRLCLVYHSQGRHADALKLAYQVKDLAPDRSSSYAGVVNAAICLQRFEEVRKAAQDAEARKLSTLALHGALYGLAFVSSDAPALEIQRRWFAENPAVENDGLSLDADTEAYAGRLNRAREVTKRAVDSAVRADSKETGAIWCENAALREAALGNAAERGRVWRRGSSCIPPARACRYKPHSPMPCRAMGRAQSLWHKS